jgi:hypothetical protein
MDYGIYPEEGRKMKVLEKELEQGVADKLNQFERLKAAYSPDLGNIVCYDGKGFSTRYVNEFFMRTVYKADEIADMMRHLLFSEGDYSSVFDSPMLIGDQRPEFMPAAAVSVKPKAFFRPDSKVVRIKEVGDGTVIALCEDGSLSRIDLSDGRVESTVNAVSIIKDRFQRAVSDSYSISDFDAHGDGYLVAAESGGVYSMDPIRGVYELKFEIPNVISVKDIGSGRIAMMVADDRDGVVIGDFATGCRLASFDCLRRSGYQLPICIEKVGLAGFAVLGRSYSPCQSGRLLHVWRPDRSESGLELMDPLLHPAKCDFSYQAKFVRSNGRYAWILGTKGGSPFVWEYDLDLPGQAPSEALYSGKGLSAEYDDLGFFAVADGMFWTSIGDRIVAARPDGTLAASCIAEGYEGGGFAMLGQSVYAVVDGKIAQYDIPKVSKSHDATVLISEFPCNNIDVLVSGQGGEGISFSDEEGHPIEPEMHLVLRSQDGSRAKHVIKLMQASPAGKTLMRITAPEGNEVEGIVARRNQLYMK